MALTGAPAPLTRAHLIHVGYPKTGSKFLQRWFRAHPQIGFVPWRFAGLADTHQLVAQAAHGAAPPGCYVTSNEVMLTPFADYRDLGGHGADPALPTRDAQRDACTRLATLFPLARILIVTRGYEALLRSFYAELVLGGASYSFLDFCEALMVQAEADADVFHFGAAIDVYRQAFGQDNVVVLPYELLRDRPGEFLERVGSMLSLEPVPFSYGKVRPSPPVERLATYRRMTRWIRAVPGPAGLRRRAVTQYILALRTNRLERAARAIELCLGQVEDCGTRMPESLLNLLRKRGQFIRGEPLSRPYALDYLLE